MHYHGEEPITITNRVHFHPNLIFSSGTPVGMLNAPNHEYNATWPNMAAGALRHENHRFEWTRKEFRNWATGVVDKHGYVVRFEPIGTEDAELGSPTQMGVFENNGH